MKKLFERYRQLRLLPKQILCQSYFTLSFSLNEYDLRILPRVFLMEMFDHRGSKLKHAKELLLNHYRKSVKIL